MTSGAIKTHRPVMHIGMTGAAIHLPLSKIKRLMALPAVDFLMLP
jgi:hypothetical protein